MKFDAASGSIISGTKYLQDRGHRTSSFGGCHEHIGEIDNELESELRLSAVLGKEDSGTELVTR
jgi:hypothetical protein